MHVYGHKSYKTQSYSEGFGIIQQDTVLYDELYYR